MIFCSRTTHLLIIQSNVNIVNSAAVDKFDPLQYSRLREYSALHFVGEEKI